MKTKTPVPEKINLFPKHRTIDHCVSPAGFEYSVTEEVYHDVGNGIMYCITSGEMLEKKTLARRLKGTNCKVSLEA